jgi:uncharacterized FlgJ-related protein
MSDDAEKYKTEWKKLRVIALGLNWVIGVGVIVDSRDTPKVRVVKGTTNIPIKKGEVMNVNLTEYPNPVKQIQKFNMKKVDEFLSLFGITLETFKDYTAMKSYKKEELRAADLAQLDSIIKAYNDFKVTITEKTDETESASESDTDTTTIEA